MKKTYEKPEIAFDDFTLSNTIAASCENRNDMPALGSCGYKNKLGLNVFYSTGMSGCDDAGLLEITGLSYDLAISANGLFNSL